MPTLTFSEAQDLLADQQTRVEDFNTPLSEWEPRVYNGQFALYNKGNDRHYTPTDNALKNLAVMGGTSEWMLKDLREDKLDTSGRVSYYRNESDADLLCRIVAHTVFNPSRQRVTKRRLWRTWRDGTLRAILSDQYAVISNQWALEQWRQSLPNNTWVVHWRGDADSIYCNVMLPDSVVMSEGDSAYAIGLHLSNSEIGLRRLRSKPLIYRHVSDSSHIFGYKERDALDKVHRGEIHLSVMAERMKMQAFDHVSSARVHLKRVVAM
jgi:hypothetical protein